MGATLEVRAELDRVHNLTRGETVTGVRVWYRPDGTRRWTKFLLLPDPGQDPVDLLNNAQVAAEAHARREED